eukprot:6746074-Prymnesium_polylepis.1
MIAYWELHPTHPPPQASPGRASAGRPGAGIAGPGADCALRCRWRWRGLGTGRVWPMRDGRQTPQGKHPWVTGLAPLRRPEPSPDPPAQGSGCALWTRAWVFLHLGDPSGCD